MVSNVVREALAKRGIEKLQHDIELGADDETTITSNSGDLVPVFSMIDGEQRLVRKLDAPTQKVLLKNLPDGSPAFWAEGMPGSPPEYTVGNVHCMLHPDFDESENSVNLSGLDRAFVDTLGLDGRFCNGNAPDKNNRGDFKTVYDRDDHMEKKHPREWRTIQLGVERLSRESERAERQGATDAMLALAGRSGASSATVTEQPAEAAPVTADAVPNADLRSASPEGAKLEKCDVCGGEFERLASHKAQASSAAHVAARGG